MCCAAVIMGIALTVVQVAGININWCGAWSISLSPLLLGSTCSAAAPLQCRACMWQSRRTVQAPATIHACGSAQIVHMYVAA